MLSTRYRPRPSWLIALLAALPAGPASAQPAEPGRYETPPTRTLTAGEAERALQRDWLFQAQGEPLLERAALEIRWARELAQRLGGPQPGPDLAGELEQLDALEKRLGELRATPATAPTTTTADTPPSWIWYPEGNATQDVPAAARFFRGRFAVPAEVQSAELRVAADDACEVFLNGQRVGGHETWVRPAVFAVGSRIKTGDNVLAVRAENRPAPSKNPAGLIVRLAVRCADGQQVICVSDSTWRAEKELHPQWEASAFDDSAWKAAAVAAPWAEARGARSPAWGRTCRTIQSRRMLRNQRR